MNKEACTKFENALKSANIKEVEKTVRLINFEKHFQIASESASVFIKNIDESSKMLEHRK